MARLLTPSYGMSRVMEEDQDESWSSSYPHPPACHFNSVRRVMNRDTSRYLSLALASPQVRGDTSKRKPFMELYAMIPPDLFREGDLVCVISYSPFKGLRGTIRKVHQITDAGDNEAPFLCYQVALEHASVKEPGWFQAEEIVSIK